MLYATSVNQSRQGQQAGLPPDLLVMSMAFIIVAQVPFYPFLCPSCGLHRSPLSRPLIWPIITLFTIAALTFFTLQH